MNKEEITIGFKEQIGFRIAECDISTGKVVVNGIEITSVEDWEKVTKSLIDLQQRIDKALELINKAIDVDSEYIEYSFGAELLRQELKEILKGENHER